VKLSQLKQARKSIDVLDGTAPQGVNYGGNASV